MRAILSSNALTSIENIYNYYTAHNEYVAIKISKEVFAEIALLEKFPALGVVEPLLKEKSNKYRSLIILKGTVKIIYFVEKDTIHISFIWHCRQNPEMLKHKIRQFKKL